MFQTWLKELSQLEELEVLVEESRRLLESFQYSITRPVLPAAIRQELMKDFNRPEMREMAARNMSASLKSETEGEVAKMSKDDFIFGICPKDYRPKDGNPLVESVVCHFLTMQQAKTEELLAQKKLLFAPQGCQVPLRSSNRRFQSPLGLSGTKFSICSVVVRTTLRSRCWLTPGCSLRRFAASCAL